MARFKDFSNNYLSSATLFNKYRRKDQVQKMLSSFTPLTKNPVIDSNVFKHFEFKVPQSSRTTQLLQEHAVGGGTTDEIDNNVRSEYELIASDVTTRIKVSFKKGVVSLANEPTSYCTIGDVILRAGNVILKNYNETTEIENLIQKSIETNQVIVLRNTVAFELFQEAQRIISQLVFDKILPSDCNDKYLSARQLVSHGPCQQLPQKHLVYLVLFDDTLLITKPESGNRLVVTNCISLPSIVSACRNSVQLTIQSQTFQMANEEQLDTWHDTIRAISSPESLLSPSLIIGPPSVIKTSKKPFDLPQFFKFITSKNVQAVRREISANPDIINSADKFGCTALHYAAIFQLPQMVWMLLQAGANTSVSDNDGRSPMMQAILNEDPRVDKQVRFNGRRAMLVMHLINTTLRQRDNNGMTVLDHTILIDLSRARAVLSFDPNMLVSQPSRLADGNTLLHAACDSSIAPVDASIVKLLLEYGALPNKLNDFGQSALHLIWKQRKATDDHRIICTELLLSHGARIDLSDSNGILIERLLPKAIVSHRIQSSNFCNECNTTTTARYDCNGCKKFKYYQESRREVSDVEKKRLELEATQLKNENGPYHHRMCAKLA